LLQNNDQFLVYILTDNTKGVLKVNNFNKTGRLIAQSDWLLANQGITEIVGFHFYNEEQLEMSDVNDKFKFLTINQIGNTTLFSK